MVDQRTNRESRWPLIQILLIPVYGALIATLLLLNQGGWHGHEGYGPIVLCLGLPWTIITSRLGGDYYVSLVLVPAVLNFLCLWFLTAMFRRWKHGKNSFPTR